MRILIKFLFVIIMLALAGCATTPPPCNKENVGAIFKQYPHWYKAAKKTERKWGVPVNVQMAIIYYESAFKADARPPRRYLLGFIPWKRLSTAYGYAQALNGTWDDYMSKAGSLFASRTRFASATDFIGWYSAQARNQLGISQHDPYNLYLAYHEGLTGYQRKSFLKKPWLMHYAKNVAVKSQVYFNQLAYYEQGKNSDYIPLNQLSPDYYNQGDKSLPELEAPSYYLCNAKSNANEGEEELNL